MAEYSIDDILGTGQPVKQEKPIEYSADEIFSPPQQQQIAPDGTTPFPEKRSETRAAKELPELGQQVKTDGIEPSGVLSGEDQARVAAIAPVLLTTTDPAEIGRILEKNFENVKVSYDPGGNILVTNNKTGTTNIVNRPGMSQLDLLQGLGIASAFLPTGRAAGLIPETIKQVSPRVAAGAAAAGGLQTGIEKIQSMVGGELDKDEIAIASALGGLGETVGPLMKAYRETKVAKGLDVARKELAEVLQTIKPSKEAVEALEKATGIKVGLFQAQQTMQPSTLLKQRLMPQLDAGAKVAAKALERQNKEVYDATLNLVNTIAPGEAVSTGSKRFKSAAEKAIQAAKDFRKQETDKLYEEAMKEGGDVNLSEVGKIIDSSLYKSKFGGELKRTMEKIQQLVGLEPPKATGKVFIEPARVDKPTLSQLQQAKFEIDAILEKEGTNALTSTTRQRVQEVKQALLDAMEKASPKYEMANKKFEILSDPVNQLEESVIGTAAKVKDQNLKLLAGKIFDPTESNPEIVKQAKKVIKSVDPKAWDDLMRVELQKRIGGIQQLSEDIPGELIGNVPGQLRRAIFGSPEKRRALLAGMNTEQRKNFVYLDDVLRRASSGRQAGSPTTPFKEALDRMRGTTAVLRDFVFKPIQSLQQTGEKGLFDRNVAKLTEALFNPEWESQMKLLRRLNPRSPRAEKLFRSILDGAKVAPQTINTQEKEQ